MKFLLVRRQGGGCDYTIDCGVAVDEIKANSLHDAVRVMRKMYRDGSSALRLVDLGYADLYAVSELVRLPLDAWEEEVNAENERAAKKLAEERERAELARLREKYGDG